MGETSRSAVLPPIAMAIDWSHSWKLGDLRMDHAQWRIVALRSRLPWHVADKASSTPPYDDSLVGGLSKQHLQQAFSGTTVLYESWKMIV